MIVASGARTCCGRHLRWLATLAVVLITLGAVTSRAQASHLRQLARSTTSFAADGERYAAWQLNAGAPIVVLDTLTGSRQTIPAPAGCELIRDHGRRRRTERYRGGRQVPARLRNVRSCAVTGGSGRSHGQ